MLKTRTRLQLAVSGRRAATTRARHVDRSTRLRRPLAASVAAMLALGGLVALDVAGTAPAAADQFAPSVAVAAGADTNPVLAGQDAVFEVKVGNSGSDDKFNVALSSLLPNGLVFQSATFIGAPTVYASGATVPNNTRTTVPSAADCAPLEPVGTPSLLCKVPAGQQLWVWQNVADLPAGADITSEVTVRPDASVFPVGSEVELPLAAYTSSDPSLLPAFDGSTSVATGSSTHTSAPGSGTASIDVSALRVTKTELESPENELLRGVHDNTTTYEIRVENTGQAATDTVVVVDYLPAGLEYLGAGLVDNTRNSPALYDGNREYPDAGSLTSTPAPAGGTNGGTTGWNGTGETVETVELDATQAAALGLAGAGVYTKVTWTLGTLSGGTAQATDLSAAGTAGEYVIRYRAAVPLFENTMDFADTSGSYTPNTTGEQTANLNNNNGASTRHGLDDGTYDRARTMTNAATAAGAYTGPVADPADAAASDVDTETIEAVDVRVVKEVDQNTFATGVLATYKLHLATSEYTSASFIELTDEIANGLCPAIPLQATTPEFRIGGVATDETTWEAAVGTECAYPYSGTGTAVMSGATITAVDFAPATGSFTIVIDAGTMTAEEAKTIEYTALQRLTYYSTTSKDGATSSGDVMTNTVELQATTTAIPALAGVTNGSGVAADGDETVSDDSEAYIESHVSGLSKKVLQRGKTLANASTSDWVDHASEPFAIGDTVWYRIRIDFAADIDTRNPKLTDFLPQGVDFVGATYRWSLPGVGSSTGEPTTVSGTAADYIPATPTQSGSVLTWQLGDDIYTDSTDRFMPQNGWVEVYVEGEVVGQSASAHEVDRPENQAKYQQENVDHEIFFLRDDAAIDLDFGAGLVKGIEANTNASGTSGNAFGSNVDGETVVQGNEVTFRIDVTAPQTDTTDYVIWDALPEGITKADVVAGSYTAALYDASATPTQTSLVGFSANVYDKTDPGYPTDLETLVSGDDRSIIVWTVSATIPGSDLAGDTSSAVTRGFTLGYTIKIPATGTTAAQITQDYVNDASIVSYDVVSNGGGAQTVVPDPSDPDTLYSGSLPAGAVEIPADGTFDPSNVVVAGPTIDKTQTHSQIEASGTTPADANNPLDSFVEGETVTYDIEVTLPANTTVHGAVLKDDGKLTWTGSPNVNGREVGYVLVSATAAFNGTPRTSVDWTAAGFDLTSGGVLIFPAAGYTTGATDETFTLTLTVRPEVQGLSLNQTQRDQLNGKSLTNTGRFSFTSPNTGTTTSVTDTETVKYRDPKPTLTKTATPTTVGANGTVTYTLTPGNTSGRPSLYDVTVLDCVPAGIAVSALVSTGDGAGSALSFTNACRIEAGVIKTDASASNTGTLITWSVSRLDASYAAPAFRPTLTYTGTVTSTAGAGTTYTNVADLSGYTLPVTIDPGHLNGGERTADDDATVHLSDATLTKSVDKASAPVGDTVEYTVEVTLPANANFYDVTLTDTLPDGVEFVTGTQQVTFNGWPTNPTVTGPTDPTSQNLEWTITPADIPLHTSARTITITFDAKLTDAIADTVSTVTNDAEFTWNMVDGDSTTKRTADDGVDVDLLDPVMAISKKVDAQDAVTREVDDTFDYEITVTNTGDTAAYNVVVTDDVPAGVKVDTATISPTPTSVGAGVSTGVGGTITWTIAGPIHETGSTSTPTSAVLGYTAAFVDSTGLDASALVNMAEVTDFESFPSGGRNYDPTGIEDTASVTPLFPEVVPTKTVTNPVAGDTYGVAYVGEAFGWTLTVENEGDGIAEDVSVTDVLPANWEYVAGSAKLSIGGSAPAALVDPTLTPASVTGGTQYTLVWSAAQLAAATPLDAGDAFIVTFDATPTAAATTTPGTGILVNPHTNTLSVAATDAQGNDHNADDDYVGPDSPAHAYIAEADLKLEKDAIGGIVAVQTDPASPLYNLAEDTWVAGQAVAAGVYDQPQWRITVTNQGPDASFGPFELVDTTTLPAGVTSGTWTAVYYASAADTAGTTLLIAGSGTSADPYVIGGSGTSLRADGSDRIELVADVTIAASATGTAENLASVNGRTYEDPANLPDNEDDATKPITSAADLGIVKTITDPLAPNVPNVGDTITWELTVTNHGPSVSVSTAGNPIVITDTVPAGMSGVTATSNADWVATLSDGSAIPAGGVDAGTEIVWTYQGASMPVGATAAVQLTGTILTSFTGTLTNTAEVEPGDTQDPATPNNEDGVDVDPDDSTTVSIEKTRVVWDATTSAWVNATDPITWGDQVSYLIDVVNNGPADARDVVVVDETPGGFSYTSKTDLTGTWTRTAGGTTSTGTAVPQWDTFTLTGTLPKGKTRSFVITYDTDPSGSGTVENWAEATIDNWDPTDPGDHFDRDDDNSGTTRVVDLGIEKSHTGAGPFTAGEPVEYTLVVTNYGPSTTNGVIEIEDSLPAGMSYVAGSAVVTVPTGTTAPTTDEPTLSGTDDRVLTWSLLATTDAFAPTETITITFDALVDPSVLAGAALRNAAEVDGPDNEPTPDPNPNRDTDDITTDTEATMDIVKTVEAGPWIAGTDVEYTLEITNSGPSEAPASVTETLPAGMTLVSMSGTGWDCPADVTGLATATCEYLDSADTNPVTRVLHPVGTTTITVVARIAASVADGTTLTNTAEVDWSDSRGSHDDDDTEDVDVTASADIRLVKQVQDATGVWVDTATVTAGEHTNYRLEVANLGPSAAVGPITVVDTLPAGVAFVALDAASATDWTATVDPSNPQQVTFALQPTAAGVAAGATAPAIVFEVALDATLPATNPPTVPALTNTATASSGTADPTPGNNTDTADLDVEQRIDLVIVKTHDATAVRIGDPLAFALDVSNTGPSAATGVTVTETIPAGLVYVDHAGSDAAWTEASVTPDAVTGETVVVYALTGSIAPGAHAPALVVNTTVEVAAYPGVTNVAEVTGAEPEDPSTTDDNESDDPVVVPPQATLLVTKTPVGRFSVGFDARYLIAIENLGTTEDPGPIVLTDDLPDGLTFRSATADGMTCAAAAGVVTCTSTRPLGVGEVFEVDLVVAVGAAAYPKVTNTAVVMTPTELLPSSDPSDSATQDVEEGILAWTGAQLSGTILIIAAMLVLGGAGAVLVTRRRRQV